MSETARWDTLIRNALIFDGTGAKPTQEDLAITDGRVAARGDALPVEQADTVIDADGQWLMPGLLDIHTHFDLEVELAPGLPEAVRHGTTTVVFGNCSLGLAFGAQRRNGEDPIVDCFARVENIPKPVLTRVVDQVRWSDSAGYLSHFDAMPLGPNVVPLLPHSMLRAEVMGLRESVSRHPTEAELARMESLVEKAMQEGYAGFSTDALPFHFLANDPHRRTKIPSQWGSYKELKRLTNVVRHHDRVWQATPPKDSPPQVLRNFLLSSGRLFGKPLKITAVAALDIATNRGIAKLGRLLSRLLNSRLINGHFRFQALAAPFKVFWDGPINPLAEEIDELRELNEPDLDDRAARAALLDDPAYQARFRKMWRHGKSGFTLANLARRLKRERMAFSRRLDQMVFVQVPGEVDALWKDTTFQEVFDRLTRWQATGEGARSEAEAAVFAGFPKPIGDDAAFMLHLLRTYDLDMRWYVVSANRDPAVVKELLFNPLVLPGFNDSGAHLTNMAFYDANLRGLKIAQAEGLDRVAWHVKRLTRDPADFFGVRAGSIEIGEQADVILVDPAALRAYDSESRMRRIHREAFQNDQLVNRSDGVVTLTLIAGKVAWSGDAHGRTLGAEQMGRVLRHGSLEPGAGRQRAAGTESLATAA
ncbi:hypothetical protein [uncultured Abyssibacter sp.]|uniref:N-acyl-D-amino-acid deacylase family protein n=1 Tax=uncultured Abyssibacter sp. TaxID=2320202 RepID=UPI0032B13465